MSGYLLDTNVISAVAPTKRDRPADLVRWVEDATEGIYLSVITAAEIRDGIAKATREGAGRKAATLRMWWDVIEHIHGSRILPLDLAAATVAGQLSDRTRGLGFAPGFADIAIAATAHVHGLTLLTDNERHFRSLGISFINPFRELPPLPGAASPSP